MGTKKVNCENVTTKKFIKEVVNGDFFPLTEQFNDCPLKFC